MRWPDYVLVWAMVLCPVWLALAFLLAGCATPPLGAEYPRTSRYDDTVEAAIRLWPEYVGELPGHCAERLRRTRLHVTWGAPFRDACMRCEPGRCGDSPPPECPHGCAAGCMLYGSPLYDVDPVIVAWPESPEVWAHELAHVLSVCAGLGAGHDHVGVWGPGGLRERLEELWR